jgi:hypothetical protein
MTLELLLWVPFLVSAILALAALGVISYSRHLVDAAAFAAARSASLATSKDQADSAARNGAAEVVPGGSRACTDMDVDVDASSFEPDGFVEVTVHCTADLAGLILVPAKPTSSATARVPLELYRDFGGVSRP